MIQVEQILVSGWPGLINNISRRVNNYSSPDVGQGNWIRQFFKTYLALSLIRTMPVMQATASPLGYCVTFLGLNCYSQSNVHEASTAASFSCWYLPPHCSYIKSAFLVLSHQLLLLTKLCLQKLRRVVSKWSVSVCRISSIRPTECQYTCCSFSISVANMEVKPYYKKFVTVFFR